MARIVLIYGKSGSGKSASIMNLPEKESFLINVNSKELPFKGSKKFTKLNTDSYKTINEYLGKIDKDQKHIKYVVVDDSQYLLVNHFMKCHASQGKGNAIFELYNNIGDNFWSLLHSCQYLRQDLTVIFLHHAEQMEDGFLKPKSIGKMLDEKVDIAGMFTIVLLAVREGKDNFFLTQNDGSSQAKSPIGMFDKERIPNDLMYVCETINNYYKE